MKICLQQSIIQKSASPDIIVNTQHTITLFSGDYLCWAFILYLGQIVLFPKNMHLNGLTYVVASKYN